MSRCITLGALVILWSISACAPYLLSDDGNAFLKGFVNQELLSFIGVIVAITLASASNLHLELNKMQDLTGNSFHRTRRGVKLSAYSLIFILGISAFLVIVKPILGNDMRASAACNSLAIVLILFSLFVLSDLTRTILSIPASSTLTNKDDGKL